MLTRPLLTDALFDQKEDESLSEYPFETSGNSKDKYYPGRQFYGVDEVDSPINDGGKVAIVDDDLDIGKTYTQVLKRSGYEVSYIAISGEEILDAVFPGNFKKGFALAIVDYHLPGINGVDTALELKRQFP